jgi:hypothetical protein
MTIDGLKSMSLDELIEVLVRCYSTEHAYLAQHLGGEPDDALAAIIEDRLADLCVVRKRHGANCEKTRYGAACTDDNCHWEIP